MGINVAVTDEHSTELRSIVDPRNLLARLLERLDTSGTVCLRFVDPYGYTTFNRAQAEVLARELRALPSTPDPEASEFVSTLISFADEVASEPHLYLQFMGD